MNSHKNSSKIFTPWIILVIMVFICFVPRMSLSSVIEEQYNSAERLTLLLNQGIDQQKYREKWLLCINEFATVYKLDPGGAWAAVSLYRAGFLYFELYKWSFLSSDLLESTDLFKRLIKRFPESKYTNKAKLMLDKISKVNKKECKNNTQSVSNKDLVNKKISLVSLALRELMIDPEQQKYRHNWFKVIDMYNEIYILESNGELAPQILFILGSLYVGLYQKSFKVNDKIKAKEIFKQLQTSFPKSSFAGKSETIMHYPKDSIVNVLKHNHELGKMKFMNNHVSVNDLRVWTNPSYTRIVIYLDRETSFAHRLLDQDHPGKKIKRLYVDLDGAKLDKIVKPYVQINDELLKSARAGQYSRNVVRIVVDIKSFSSYKIFTLENPYRIVMDILGEDKISSKKQRISVDSNFSKKLPQEDTIVRQLSLGVSKIVIDPGHGGKDHGASGILKGLYEKDITLQIANRLAKKIRKKLKCEVILTRETDCYLTLEERTAIANTENADLFISIHTNAAKNNKAYGIETFFLNLATDEEAVIVAARENATSTKNISDLESILNDLIQNAKISESNRLAFYIQNNLCSFLTTSYDYIFDKGVKQAPFYVLLGAQMPAVLIETSFISNTRECERLKDVQYQETICDGIILGIKKYIN